MSEPKNGDDTAELPAVRLKQWYIYHEKDKVSGAVLPGYFS